MALQRIWLRTVARLVPREQRADWVEEWEAELTARADGGRHAWGALPDAWYLRMGGRTMGDWLGDASASFTAGSLVADLRYTMRRLGRAPLFTVVTVLTLAAGIGSNAAIFSVINGVLLEPLPFEDPETLVGVWHTAPGLGFDDVNQSPGLHFTYVTDSRAFESVGMWDDRNVSVTGLDEPQQLTAVYVTHEVLPLLGVPPVVGRTFTSEEDSPSGAETVVLGFGWWQDAFAGDPSVIGRTISINGVAREVIGVMPRSFRFLRYDPAVYLPFRFDESTVTMGDFSYQGIARLAEGTTIEQATADVDRMVPVAIERYPGPFTVGMMEEVGFAGQVRPLKNDVIGDIGSVLWVLLGTVGLVLLIACANVANLFMVRAEGRHREIAVRTAMGAGRSRITIQMLLESLVLGIGGGVVGLGLAWLGVKLLVRLGPGSIPRMEAIGIDPLVLAFTFLLSVFAGLLFGLLPAVQYGRSDLVGSLREGGRGGSEGRSRHAARNALVVAQMSLALVLLTASGLMLRSFQALRAVEPGVTDPAHLLTFRVTIPTAQAETDEEVIATYRAIADRVSAIPGVVSTAMGTSVTMDGFDSNDGLAVEDFPVAEDVLPPIRRMKSIGAGFHETLGNPLLAGRAIGQADIDDGAPVVMVTADFARDYWPTPAEAVGRRVARYTQPAETEWYEIIGVVGAEFDDGTSQPSVPTVFWPQVQRVGDGIRTPRSIAFAVRTTGDPSGLISEARAAVWSVNSDLPLARVATVEEFVRNSMARTSFTMVLLMIAAGLAMFLGSVGIYGVISYVVTHRTREIGVRMALGAAQSDVLSMVLRQGGRLVAAGVTIGLVAAAGLTQLMASVLFGVRPIDVPTFASVAGVLSIVALVASWLPARRASSLDPVAALRSE